MRCTHHPLGQMGRKANWIYDQFDSARLLSAEARQQQKPLFKKKKNRSVKPLKLLGSFSFRVVTFSSDSHQPFGLLFKILIYPHR
uniref:Uncharacterized protein n=1 Tax=Arundo donax TaxID=35708 RepID=A0A0A9EKZ2_ARUDO